MLLPGLVVAVRPGRRLPSDQMWTDGLVVSSPARTLVDNLTVSCGRAHLARTLSGSDLGDWVARQAQLLGDRRLNRLRGSLGFWEAYLSNHIEGTVFAVEQAEEIVATGELPADRPADGHDILGTFRVVTDPVERVRVPRSGEELLEILLARHRDPRWAAGERPRAVET